MVSDEFDENDESVIGERLSSGRRMWSPEEDAILVRVLSQEPLPPRTWPAVQKVTKATLVSTFRDTR